MSSSRTAVGTSLLSLHISPSFNMGCIFMRLCLASLGLRILGCLPIETTSLAGLISLVDVRLSSGRIGPGGRSNSGQAFSYLSSSYLGPCPSTHDIKATATLITPSPLMFCPLLILKNIRPSLILAIPSASASACPCDNLA